MKARTIGPPRPCSITAIAVVGPMRSTPTLAITDSPSGTLIMPIPIPPMTMGSTRFGKYGMPRLTWSRTARRPAPGTRVRVRRRRVDRRAVHGHLNLVDARPGGIGGGEGEMGQSAGPGASTVPVKPEPVGTALLCSSRSACEMNTSA